ncbi:MAG: 1-deoxy-D-xylulose-5-phosphate synthase [Myxococcota bacterium]|nr:1-deoxy-D-xylulose-5-phosphate synthase [Myxococcota bacterium]
MHALTQKGKGYPPAEAGVENLHGVSAFHPETGEPLKSGAAPTWSHVFGDHLTGLARRDPRIAAITAAMPSGTGLSGFAAAFPDRFFDVGIAEQHAVTFACGLAAAGLRPVAAIYSTFLQRAMDQVIHDLAIQKLPVTLALDRAGLVGADGRTHHGAFDLALLRGVPNLIIAAPSDEVELRALLELAIGSNLPFAIRFPRGPAEPPIPAWGKNPPLGIGVSRWLLRRGDIAVLTLGPMGRCALDAIAGCSAPERFGLMDLRFAKPLDARAITGAAASSNALVVIEEGVRAGGVGEAVLGLLNDAEIQRPVIRLGLDDVFHDHGSQDELRAQAGLSRQHITAVLDDLAARFPQ